MQTLKALVVDDEAPARALLKEYIQQHPQLQWMAECKNGIEAIGVINVLKPDLVFLDVQMPGKTGLEVVKEVDELPAVIFSTAYDHYALEAFEANAVDYLLKPFTSERFGRAVAKAVAGLERVSAPLRSLVEWSPARSFPERILVEQGNKLVAIRTADIQWIEADGDYTKIHTTAKPFLSNRSLSQLTEKLDPQQFLRIHRSYLIRLAAIKEVHREPAGPVVVLDGGVVLKVSRGYADKFRELML